MRGLRLALALAALALLTALGGWLATTYRWVKVPTWQGYRGQAATNPFLALQRFSVRMGHPATCLHGLPDLARLPVQDTLVLPRRRVAPDEAQARAVAAWVDRGGTLILEGLEPETEGAPRTRDPLFRPFSLRLLPARDPDATGLLKARIQGTEVTLYTGQGLRLRFTGKGDPTGAATSEGTQAIQINRGAGEVYAFTRLDWLANSALGERDHAEAFSLMALRAPEAGEAPHRVWIVAWEGRPGLAAWLWRNARPLLLAGLALAALVLWARAARFGPMAEAQPPGGRRFLEHLDAAGQWHWRREDGRPLLQACRAAFLRRLAQVHPGWAGLDPDALCQRLARHAGLDEAKVFQALRYDTAEDPDSFLEAIRTLETLRKQL
ncbi:DUF4350 domain-containing protein [Mesoterricola sediminis]|uniref:DUF4350 domain-containing protein n=1 Tax=Mesoterricola sediminis TaxID=2927980 RepID=A0AA48GVY2_9BACT|nr:DUF4350 domain-containing protein [Mesoterricola sediminis]BDU77264.1 hypothetical protein METESE_22220 [Mesoterricola sediminis]